MDKPANVPLTQMPLTPERYFPDPDEPIDRWFQADNASNACTTAEILKDVVREPPDLVVDPFCGAGSTASAARALGLSFYGIEMDPVLACISLAKTKASTHHATLLEDLPNPHGQHGLSTALAAIRESCQPEDAPVVSAMAILLAFRSIGGKPLRISELHEDLIEHTPGGSAGRSMSEITRGDACAEPAWQRLDPGTLSIAIYTSPPFGRTSPVHDRPDYINDAARDVLATYSADTLGALIPDFVSYLDATLAMIRRAVAHLSRGTIIIEHEPDDQRIDSTYAVLDAVRTEFPDALHDSRIVQCGQFSRRGIMSLMILELR